MTQQTKLVIIGVVCIVLAIIIYVWYNRAKKLSEQGRQFVDFVHGNIPKEVAKEPVADWEGEILIHQGVSYTPKNGVWSIV